MGWLFVVGAGSCSLVRFLVGGSRVGVLWMFCCIWFGFLVGEVCMMLGCVLIIFFLFCVF